MGLFTPGKVIFSSDIVVMLNKLDRRITSIENMEIGQRLRSLSEEVRDMSRRERQESCAHPEIEWDHQLKTLDSLHHAITCKECDKVLHTGGQSECTEFVKNHRIAYHKKMLAFLQKKES